MDHTYYIDRDPRPKTHPCHWRARDVEAGSCCICAPSQPKTEPLMLRTFRKSVGVWETPVYAVKLPEQPKITTANGLLYREGVMIPLPEADEVAVKHGHYCAERFVRALEASR